MGVCRFVTFISMPAKLAFTCAVKASELKAVPSTRKRPSEQGESAQ